MSMIITQITIKICTKNKGHFIFFEPHPISGMALSTYLHYNPPKPSAVGTIIIPIFQRKLRQEAVSHLLKITQQEIDKLGFMLRLLMSKAMHVSTAWHCFPEKSRVFLISTPRVAGGTQECKLGLRSNWGQGLKDHQCPLGVCVVIPGSLLPLPGHMPGNAAAITHENFRLITVTLPRFKNALGKE